MVRLDFNLCRAFLGFPCQIAVFRLRALNPNPGPSTLTGVALGAWELEVRYELKKVWAVL